jgi:hypothetical protein
MRILIATVTAILLALACVPACASIGDPQFAPQDSLSFFGTVGSVVMMVLSISLVFPYSLLPLGCMSLIALSKFGRRRWRVWLVIGIIYAMPSILIYGDGPRYSPTPDFLLSGTECEFVGHLTVMLVCAIAAAILYATRIRPRIMGDGGELPKETKKD